jgi:hypothetical protein
LELLGWWVREGVDLWQFLGGMLVGMCLGVLLVAWGERK